MLQSNRNKVVTRPTRKYQTEEDTLDSLATFKAQFQFSRVGGVQGIKGTAHTGRAPKSKRPRVFDQVRVCSHDDCEKTLSTYNKGPNCYQHSSLRFPRVRGKQLVKET